MDYRAPLSHWIEENEVADGWAKNKGEAPRDADRLPREDASITTIAHAARGITEAKWNEHLAWVLRQKALDTYESQRRIYPKHKRALPPSPTTSG
jgi:hypothetical protein